MIQRQEEKVLKEERSREEGLPVERRGGGGGGRGGGREEWREGGTGVNQFRGGKCHSRGYSQDSMAGFY